MFDWITNILRRINGISTPVGGLSWSSNDQDDPPTFDGVICITCVVPDNQSFLEFTNRNVGRIVFLNSHIDSSMALERQERWVKEQLIDLDALSSGRFSGRTLAFPNEAMELVSVVFHFRDGHVLSPSHGGTGILMIEVIGFFEISFTFHGGPSRAIHLKEVEAPFDLRARLMANRKRSQ